MVYEAFDRERRAVVALKTIGHFSAEALLHLKAEFRVVQDLQHPNLVQLGELIEEAGEWFFTMERVHGVDLVSYVRGEAGRADEARLRFVLPQLVKGLGVLHAAAKVHRDVKPSNVLVTPEGRVVLLDFGVARDLLDAGDEEDMVIGTASYMAPEQAEAAPLTPAADWYALGVVLFQALTGELPFTGTVHQMLEQKLLRDAPAPSARFPDVPADLDALCRDLLRREPEERPRAAEILRRLGAAADELGSRARLGAFVGRVAELQALEQAFEGVVAEKRAVAVLIEGESGVGKSRLAASFSGEVAQSHPGTRVFFARCYERESVPYKAVDGIIDGIAKFLALQEGDAKSFLPDSSELLAQAFPVLAPFVRQARPSERAPIASPAEQRTRLFRAVRELLRKLVTGPALVLVIDDLQWADPDSLALLSEVLRPPLDPSILLVMTVRSGSSAGAEQLAARSVRRIPLAKLPASEAEELILQLLEAPPGAKRDPALEERVRSIAAESGGHPLFIDELVRSGAAGGEGTGRVRLDSAIWRRVSRIDAEARRVLELTAVAGLPLAQSTVGAAAALEDAALASLATTLRAERLVRTSGVSRRDTIEPYHDRVRESVLAHLDEGERRTCHARLAAALESEGDADPEVLATQWLGAQEPARAGGYMVRAGDRAAKALAFDRAARLYRRAMELGSLPEADVRTVKGRLAEALTNAGRDAEAGEVRLALAQGAVGALEAVDLRRRAAEHFLCSGHVDRGIDLLRSALRDVHVAYPKTPLAVVVRLVFFRLLLRLRGVSFREREESSIPPATLVRIDTLRSAGLGLSMQDNARGAYFQTRSLLAALDAGEPHRILLALTMEMCFTAIGGTRTQARARELLAPVHALAARLDTPVGRALAATGEGWLHFFLGQWPEAVRELSGAERIFRDQCIGVAYEISSVRVVLYRALAHTGELRELAARVQPVVRDVESRGDGFSAAILRATALVVLGVAADEPEKTRSHLAEARQWLSKERFQIVHYYVFLAEMTLDLYCGDAAAALARVKRTWPALRRSLLLRMQNVRGYAVGFRVRTLLALAAEDPVRRPELHVAAERDVARMEREGHVWADAEALLFRATIDAQRGDAAQARTKYARAIEAFSAMGMKLDVACTRRRLGELLGGDEGAARVREADAVLAAEEVRDPVKFARTHAPEIRPAGA